MTMASPWYTYKANPYSSHGRILAQLGAGLGRTCIDVGCASGYLAGELTAAGWNVVGVEPDPAAAEVAQAHGVDVRVASIDDVDFATLPPYDAVVFGDVLEHLARPEVVLANALEHLAADGRIVISVPNVANLLVRAGLLFGRFDYTDRGILDRTHLRFFTRRTLGEFVGGCGLSIERTEATPVPVEELLTWLRRRRAVLAALHAITRLRPTLFGYQFVVSCRPSPGPGTGNPSPAR
jgi:2-polyprenyl-3-methyl-5-hydroxy-6-metoxy-1,4-benzoquinol methylase